MKTLFTIAVAAAVIYVVLKAAQERSSNVPTLLPVQDADPLREEPLRDEDLKVAQNAPF